ncbi:MAG: hydroxymethylbilane synthase [Pseudomonadales bacterium]|nr:hydroxymethylbilane synthase [Pseudomonadales bacterium]
MTKCIRLATRESVLAMWQANYVKAALERAHTGLEVEIVGMTTAGDRDKQSPLSQMGGKGVFIKELEIALFEGRADIAVHSMKDVPSVIPDGLQLSAICEREDPRDAFVSAHYTSLMSLPAGAKIGSSSLRRRLQLQLVRPDLVYEELRGNVGTRLSKLDAGEYDAIILATAGLIRLELSHRVSEKIDPSLCIPSAGQGAVGIESRIDDEEVNSLLAAVNHQDTYDRVICERTISSGLGADCSLPIAAFARLIGDEIELSTYVSDREGREHIRIIKQGSRQEGISLAKGVVEVLLAKGAAKMIGEQV